MADSQYISVREAANLLGVSEKKIMDLIQSTDLKAYKIADQFLRLKKAEVLALRKSGEVKNENVQFEYTAGERIRDLFYFNSFYIVSLVIIGVLISIILYS
ncbi:MAG TPA: helix-turn-helix domain-containing protein [Candidatus Omnitrophota bacterium]|nr:helix-turn-helix domain-containing protein [Candidatus Omnitrophota bacterium]HSA31337.1 helix-turn-helix domain-containing protein [Candidatus Omnitrophota bacterium]